MREDQILWIKGHKMEIANKDVQPYWVVCRGCASTRIEIRGYKQVSPTNYSGMTPVRPSKASAQARRKKCRYWSGIFYEVY